MKLLTIHLCLLVFPCFIFGQTESDFDKRHISTKYYKVRPNTLVSPRFDAKGQLCRLNIFANPSPDLFHDSRTLFQVAYPQGDKDRLIPKPVLNQKELKEIYEEFVSAEERTGIGEIITDFSGFGGYYRIGHKYEKVAIHVLVLIQNTTRIDTRRANNLDSVFNPPDGVITSAVIRWNERPCMDN